MYLTLKGDSYERGRKDRIQTDTKTEGIYENSHSGGH
jgi:hypothetical protein